MNNALMFSKQSDEWETPQALFDSLHKEFAFDLDVAASAENTKCDEWFDTESDALSRDWCGLWGDATFAWCNPPYSKCAEFVAKADEQRRKWGITTVMLIPSRTDTRYFHAHIWDQANHQPRPGVQVRFIKGRLKFGAGKNSAPFPSMVVIFRPVDAVGRSVESPIVSTREKEC